MIRRDRDPDEIPIANEITDAQIRIISNKYLSAISYEPGVTTVITAETLRQAAGFQQYEMEEDVSKDLAEFALANAIYTALVEGHAAEISARRTAMENASNVRIYHLSFGFN
jgi:F-type H+-transporting ATPase subunit gamma